VALKVSAAQVAPGLRGDAARLDEIHVANAKRSQAQTWHASRSATSTS